MRGKEIISSEDLILREIQNHGHFKAKPLNKKIFTKVVGVPEKTERTSIHHFDEFNLHTVQRFQQKAERSVQERS